MLTTRLSAAALLLLIATPACAQTTDDPFPDPIDTGNAIVVGVAEFASIPDVEGEPARVMTLVDEPGTGRLFVSGQRGPIHAISYDGGSVTEYVDVDDPRWGVGVQSSGRERGVQSLAFHPQFAEPDAPGSGKFYTWTDVEDTGPDADFEPGGGSDSHDTVLLEWTARDPGAETYDGDPPRELFRQEQPFGNHNGGQIAFNPLASPGDPDFGLLYVGSADGGSGGDPLDLGQDLGSAFGKILRIDPLGSDSDNGAYGIPADNPFAGDDDPDALGEIYAYGLRNPQHLAWDPATGTMFVADIGQNMVEEVSVVTAGANLGWNDWEGSFRFVDRSSVGVEDPRGDPDVTYPVAEYDHRDPLVGPRAAVTGLRVYRPDEIPSLTDLVLFGDLPSGEIFTFDADELPDGGQDHLRRVLLDGGGGAETLLDLVRAKNEEQGRSPSSRVDLRLGAGPGGEVFLLNKHDGVIRVLVPGDATGS